MKNNYHIKSAFIISLVSFLSCAFSQIPNQGFENWTSGNCFLGLYTYNDPVNWGTINVLTCSGNGFTALQTNSAQAHSGTHALKLTTVSIFGNVAPGICATGVINQSTQNIDGGFADNVRHSILEGWFKYAPSGADTFSVQVDFYTGSITPTNKIGGGYFSSTVNVAGYTKFAAYIDYTSAAQQDSAVITILCSSPVTHGNPGSTAYVDDLFFVDCSAFTATPSFTDAICTSNIGTAGVVAANGTAPYSYHWSNASTASSLSNLSQGNYSVTVMDDNLCSLTASGSVALNSIALNLTPSSTAATCTAGNGGAGISVSNGTNPYYYNWSNSGTSDVIIVVGGSYDVTVHDTYGCSGTANVIVPITQVPINVSTGSTPTACGSNTGTAFAATADGSQPYTFLWTGGSINDTLYNLGAGNYNVTISDNYGCSGTGTTSVTTPSGPSATDTITNLTCNGDSSGAVAVTVSGGTAPVTYLWNTGADSLVLDRLVAATYTLTINDFNNCSFLVTANVTEPAQLTAAHVTTDISCHGDLDGAIDITASGGTAPYYFLWTNSAITEDINNLPPGNTCVTITDAHNCSFQFCDSIEEPAVLAVTETHVNLPCYGQSSGSVSVTVSGGTSGYIYLWSNGSTSQNLTNLAAGSDTLRVTDFNGCISSLVAAITEPAQLYISSVVTNASSSTSANGAISVSPTGGTPPYSSIWSSGNGSNLLPGVYCTTVSDYNSCSVSKCDTVRSPNAVLLLSDPGIKLYPNPANDNIIIETNSSSSAFSLALYNLEGKLVEEKMITGEKVVVDIKQLPEGLYSYQLRNLAAGTVNVGKLQIDK